MRSLAQLAPARPPLALYSVRCREATALITDRRRRLSRSFCFIVLSLLQAASFPSSTSLPYADDNVRGGARVSPTGVEHFEDVGPTW